MANTPNPNQKKVSGSRRLMKAFKKNPLLLITPILVVIIIVLAILLITTTAALSKAVAEKTEVTATATAMSEEISAPSYSYDESKWKMDMQSGFLTYDDPAYKTSIGVDVSEWSLDIDWEKVKAAGVDFAICRVGYRGYGTGKFQLDTKLEEYLKGADAAGIKTGVYFVTQAINEEEAIEEANLVLEKIKGMNVTMPIYIDCESNTGDETRTDALTKEDWTNNAIAFCKTIEAAGYRAGVYSNETWISKWLDMSRLTDYDIWFAKYTNTPATEIPFTVWQYASDGQIDGITTNADLNIRIEKK